MSEPDPVPTYTAQPGPTDLPEDQHQQYINENNNPYPVKRWPRASPSSDSHDSNDVAHTQREVILRFFSAISSKDYDLVASMLTSNLVMPETTNLLNQTPLTAATAQGHTRMVQCLLDFDADVNAFSSDPTSGQKGEEALRTPLMVAAAAGNLTLVKLLMGVYHADDALISPDGQLALRLAAEAGHREIVDYLPPRRGGGWRRWKSHHAKAVRRTKEALDSMRRFCQIVFWYVPKILLWELPRWAVVMPVVKRCKWCWANKGFLFPWCRRKIEEVPEQARKAVGWLKRALSEVAGRMKKLVVHDVPAFVKALPGRLWRGLKHVWHFLTVRVPSAINVSALWIWGGVKAVGESVFQFVQSVASFIHTILLAVASFFRSVTLKDIWHGFCRVLGGIFVSFPQQIWTWLRNFGDASYKVLKYIASEFGKAVWWIGWLLGWIVVFLPRKIWVVVASMGGSVAKGVSELRVWMNPKAV